MRDYTPAQLPAFSFNPGNIHASTPSTSTVTAPRPIGHRRRPSELIGQDGPPSPRMMGTSPGTADGENATVPAPGMSAPSRGPGRRGHAHRRSQAMSSMDLTALTLAAPPIAPQILTVGSAPTTPADSKHDFQGHMSRPMSRSAVDLLPQPSPPVSPAKQPMTLRPDFTFHDRPRPVSMISTETSSSLSTVRPNHSRVSSAAPSNKIEGSSSTETIKARPKTADAGVLMSKLSRPSEHFSEMSFLRRSSVGMGPLGLGRQSSETVDMSDTESIKDKHSSKKNKKKKKRRKEEGNATFEEQKRRWNSLSTERTLDITQDPSAEKWESASSFNSRSGAEDSHPRRGDDCHGKKQKKVRNWAGHIFPLKNKRTHVKRPLSRRSPTPPPILTRTNSDLGSIEVNFDEDNTVIIRTPTNPNIPKQTTQDTEGESDKAFEKAWKPRSFYEQGVENDTFSPVIDLDAALGPFNTPEMGAGRIAGSAFSQATKRMYSGGRRGEFVGPEMRYHRRAESAPEMPPFDRSALIGFPRLGSDNAMASVDVFYEEEEDAFLAEHQSPTMKDQAQADVEQANAELSSVIDEESEGDMLPSSSETLQAVQRPKSALVLSRDDGLGIQVADDTVVEDGPGDAVEEEEEEEAKENETTLSHHQTQNKNSVEIVEADQWAHPRVPHHANHSPELSPHMLAIDKRPCSSPLDLNSGFSQLTLPSRHTSSSAFPSPDPSNMSFDGPRSATASSMTDHTTFNQSLHDQRQSSFEDVPSLSSSASTRTNPRGRISSSFYPHSSSERRESFNALPPRSSHSNSAKRSSLVSLSRLVGASYGEKSKLSHEEKPPADEAEKTRRKSNRVSRLMFWKSKDKQNDS
ncbi:uncharacterized protein BHQ10_002147 [Talaromyces amestolkiae]|uniref:Cell wall proline rich protein n=1 Tax=Talaromyces amestolkiae TaxID=1196081 RepID=A0A364KRG8_TALAM|nr:uncharacterized protein BHQ10_002147 [Talaromyces amestolkiae]RAO66135.1 hypothetical protein BHQ10_002147 [Talaromyces amestolkiae]